MDYAKNNNKVIVIENSIGNSSDFFWDVEHICTTSLALMFFKYILMS